MIPIGFEGLKNAYGKPRASGDDPHTPTNHHHVNP